MKEPKSFADFQKRGLRLGIARGYPDKIEERLSPERIIKEGAEEARDLANYCDALKRHPDRTRKQFIAAIINKILARIIFAVFRWAYR